MTQSAFEIPLVPRPQKLTIALAGVQYQLTVRPNDAGQFWVLDIRDSQGVDILTGLSLVTGVDLLEQFEYLGIGGELWVFTDRNPPAMPTFVNLGVSSHLLFVTDDP